MKELGEYFRTTRTNNGVSLEEASEDLNLSISQLENIEEGNIRAFQDVYKLKNYINSYAKYLGINPSEVVDSFDDFLFEHTSKISLDDIIKSFPKFKPQEKEIKRDFTRRIISIEDKINEIKSILSEKTSFYFDEIAGEIIKEEKIASMLGILELAKAKEAYLTQSDHLERIHIERWKDIG